MQNAIVIVAALVFAIWYFKRRSSGTFANLKDWQKALGTALVQKAVHRFLS